jgi:hypothetical protein
MKSVPPPTQTIGKLIPKGGACHGDNGGVPGHSGTASIDDDSAIEILSGEGQRINRLCQRAYAVAMPFLNATAMKQGADKESMCP